MRARDTMGCRNTPARQHPHKNTHLLLVLYAEVVDIGQGLMLLPLLLLLVPPLLLLLLPLLPVIL